MASTKSSCGCGCVPLKQSSNKTAKDEKKGEKFK